MLQRQEYYKNGKRISDAEALDANHVMKDGVVCRVPVTLRDSFDGSFNRPGFHLSDAAGRDARQAALDAYIEEQQNAWRHLPSTVSDADTEHRHDDTKHQLRSLDHKSLTLDQLRRHHDEAVAEPLAEYQRELTEAWRRGK